MIINLIKSIKQTYHKVWTKSQFRLTISPGIDALPRSWGCIGEMDKPVEEDHADFRVTLSQPQINLPQAALLFARAIAYPRLDVPFYLSRLDALAEAARQQVATPTLQARPLPERIDALSDFLFSSLDFQGNRDHYSDPRNSFLNCVLDRKTGIPISLSLVYISIARRLGLNAYGIGLPGHFIAGVEADGRHVYVDPFNAGLRLSTAACERLVKESSPERLPFQPGWLTPVRGRDFIARMLTNLCHAYIQSEDWRSAIHAIQHLLIVQPEFSFHLRDLGYLYLYNGSLRLSAQYLEAYLQRAPNAPDFDKVLSSLEIVTGRMALWN